MNNEKILDRFLQNRGLIPSIFGKYSDQIVFDSVKEKAKLILFEVYGYKDIYTVLPSEIDEEKVFNYTRTFMNMDLPSEKNEKGNTEK